MRVVPVVNIQSTIQYCFIIENNFSEKYHNCYQSIQQVKERVWLPLHSNPERDWQANVRDILDLMIVCMKALPRNGKESRRRRPRDALDYYVVDDSPRNVFVNAAESSNVIVHGVCVSTIWYFTEAIHRQPSVTWWLESTYRIPSKKRQKLAKDDILLNSKKDQDGKHKTLETNASALSAPDPVSRYLGENEERLAALANPFRQEFRPKMYSLKRVRVYNELSAERLRWIWAYQSHQMEK